MCVGGSAPSPSASASSQIPQRQAARAPDMSAIGARTSDQARKRLGMAAAILTPQAVGLAPASTTATATKSLLGQ